MKMMVIYMYVLMMLVGVEMDVRLDLIRYLRELMIVMLMVYVI